MYAGMPYLMDTGKTSQGGFQILRITEGNYSGIEFHYTKVNMEEKKGDMHLQFEYIIDFGLPPNTKDPKLEQMLGESLEQLIFYQLDRNETIYSGGVEAP